MPASAKPGFAHLHVHTDYSMLDGAARIKDLVDEVARLEQPAVAITDHGFLFGAYEFWSQAKSAGLNPVIGIEAYLTPGTSRFDKSRVYYGDLLPTGKPVHPRDDVSGGGVYTHMTMWARDNTGLHNLFRLASAASLEGQHGKYPRMDRELLSLYGQGMIATTGCPSGEVQTRLRLGQYDQAMRAAGEFQEIFGPENFFVELMDHGLDIETRVRADLLRLAKDLNAPLVATNDLHYVREDDAASQDALAALNSGARLDDPNRFKFDGTGYYVKSAAEMARLFPDHPEALANTLAIAERCDVSFDLNANFMPHFEVPAGDTEESFFRKAVAGGLAGRFPGGVPAAVQERADWEMGIIVQMGFCGYFLIVADFINWAKDNGIRVGPGRGSGAGSMVAYAMRIVDVNPLEYGLLFERFLNPERVSMPDFDVDFDERRRDDVIEYVTNKYGKDNVAQIVTYGTIKTKQALRDSVRLLNLPVALGEKLTKVLPPSVAATDITVAGIYNQGDDRYAEAQEFRDFVAADPAAGPAVELAKGIEGLKRQWGVHACGVIMSNTPLTEVIPIMKRPADGATITQFTYQAAEELGLIKMDFLGLRNLTIIEDALENIIANGKEPLNLEALPLTDQKTYELLASGHTLGVFQLDGGAMRSLLKLMRPDRFDDISAVLALYRPGPMGMNSHTNYALRKNGQQAKEPIHPELAEPLADILDETHGLIVYQEQVMAAARKVAGYSLGGADLLRKAMGKKKRDVLEKQQAVFFAGMAERGFSPAAQQALWNTIESFAEYAFNKSHTVAYGLVSYWTAYLKANYPGEYMAALLQSTRGDKDKLAMYLNECRRMGITVLLPDVNGSAYKFNATGEGVRFGLSGVRNVGDNVVESIIAARQSQGAFTSFTDFLEKVPAVVCNKRTIESLIKAGAFDSLEASRKALMLIHDAAVDEVITVKRQEAEGIFDLFSGFGSAEPAGGVTVKVPLVADWDKGVKLDFEREMLGLYVSDHPLAGLEVALAAASQTTVSGLKEGMQDGGGSTAGEAFRENATVRLAGLITGVSVKVSKNGNPYAMVELEDMTGSIEVSFFGDAYLKYSHALKADAIVSIGGRVQRRDETVSLRAVDLSLVDVSVIADAPLTLTLAPNRLSEGTLGKLKYVLQDHQGNAPVRLVVVERGKRVTIEAASAFNVNKTPALYSDLQAVLGVNCLRRAALPG